MEEAKMCGTGFPFSFYDIHILICITTQRGPSAMEEAKMCGTGFLFSFILYTYIYMYYYTALPVGNGRCKDVWNRFSFFFYIIYIYLYVLLHSADRRRIFVSPNMFRIIHVCTYIYIYRYITTACSLIIHICIYIHIYTYNTTWCIPWSIKRTKTYWKSFCPLLFSIFLFALTFFFWLHNAPSWRMAEAKKYGASVFNFFHTARNVPSLWAVQHFLDWFSFSLAVVCCLGVYILVHIYIDVCTYLYEYIYLSMYSTYILEHVQKPFITITHTCICVYIIYVYV